MMKNKYFNLTIFTIFLFLTGQTFSANLENRYLKFSYPDKWQVAKSADDVNNDDESNNSNYIEAPDNPSQEEKLNKDITIDKENKLNIQIVINKGETIDDIITINEFIKSVGGKVFDTKKFKFKGVDAYKMTLESGNERTLVFGFVKNSLTYTFKYTYPKAKILKNVEKVMDSVEIK